MHINIITLFPDFFSGPLNTGLMQKARDKGLLTFSLLDPRDKATDRHRTVDDKPFGGSPGMLMQVAPIAALLRDLGISSNSGGNAQQRTVLLSPAGRSFDQTLARDLTASCGNEGVLTLICGRYEGIDARLEELFPLESISVGDFVLNGGEAGALCLVEAVARLLPGFMGHEESGADESFSSGLLEYPHYTRPELFEGLAAPEVLRSGDHGKISRWRRQAALRRTFERRPEMLSEAALDADDEAFLASLEQTAQPQRALYCALVHYPVLDRMNNSVAVSLTNLDIHDIARSSCTYGLGGYYVITPMQDQLELLERLLGHWNNGRGGLSNPDRKEALGKVKACLDIATAIEEITVRHGQQPFVCGTSAAGTGLPRVSPAGLYGLLADRPVLILLGTGRGLAPEALAQCNAVLPPIRPRGGYNHLSVRAAAAILFDRIIGDWR